MEKSIDYWLVDAQSCIVKAVDDGGRIVGFACWVKATGDTSTTTSSTSTQTPSAPAKVQGQGQAPAQDPSRTLSQLMREDMVRFQEKHLTGKRYMILQALAKLPECQGHGVGTRLVQWGVDRADSDSLLCWAHASPASHSLYERAGFRELGRCGFDLAEWAPGGKEGGRGWGVYIFRYMLRPARK